MNTQYKKNLKDAMTACKNYTDKKIDDLKLVSVSANPTLAGTEADLTGLEIDGVKYAVPQGGSSGGGSEVHLYKHSIKFEDDTFIELYTLSSTPITISDLKSKYAGRYQSNRDANPFSNTVSLSEYVNISSSKISVKYVMFDMANQTITNSFGTLTSLTDTVTEV